MKRPYMNLLPLVVCAVTGGATAADWPGWRGASRNGIAADSPPLEESWPKGGPPLVWKSERIPSASHTGGYASPAVAEGRVFQFVCWKYREPIATRTLSQNGLRALGGTDKLPPEAIVQAVEAARISDERAQLKGKELGAWIKQWVETKLDEEQRKQFSRFAQDRLQRGETAFDLNILGQLATIRNKVFPSPEALDQWFAENKIPDNIKAAALKQIPADRELARDVIMALDAQDGKTIWKKEYSGRVHAYGSSSTPCVGDGRCYVAGSDGMVYCLDAKTGDEVWTKQVGKGEKSCSFALVDGVAIAPLGPLVGLDAQTGQELWRQEKIGYAHASPAYWRKDGLTYLVCNAEKEMACIDPKTGAILWTAPGGGSSTVAIESDYAVVFSGRKEVGVTAYKLAKEGASKLWSVEGFTDRGASPIVYKGCVYAIGSAGALCVKLETGETLWKEKPGTGEICSPVLADGKIFAFAGSAVVAIQADPQKFRMLGRLPLGMLSVASPAVADGRIYLRVKEALACFDLTKRQDTAGIPGV